MTLPSPRLVIFASGLLLAFAAAAPARAEGNRLLPFWAQPFPTGYVWREAGIGAAGRDCAVARRVRTSHGWRTVVEDRCGPVLHARD